MDTSNTNTNPSPSDNKPTNSIKPGYDKKSHGKRYSLPHKLAVKALQRSGMSVSQASSLAKMPLRTTIRIWKDPEIDDLTNQQVSYIKDGLSKIYYKRALEGLKAIDSEKLSQASALQLMTMSAIGTEKGRLMEGLSTNNVSHNSVIQHIDSEVHKITDQLNAINE